MLAAGCQTPAAWNEEEAVLRSTTSSHRVTKQGQGHPHNSPTLPWVKDRRCTRWPGRALLFIEL